MAIAPFRVVLGFKARTLHSYDISCKMLHVKELELLTFNRITCILNGTNSENCAMDYFCKWVPYSSTAVQFCYHYDIDFYLFSIRKYLHTTLYIHITVPLKNKQTTSRNCW